MRRAVGPDRTLGIRVSADEFLLGGLTLDDMTDIVRRLVDAVQVDFVDVSHSAYHGSYTISTQMADMAFAAETFQPLTRAVGAALDGAARRPVVMTACRYTDVARAEAMLAPGGADMVGMARAHIADPAIVAKARGGREAETTPCISCNQGCAGMLALNLAITCLTNPRAGREGDWPLPALTRARDFRRVAVVGAGPAGLEAAAVAAERGYRVTLHESEPAVGGALRWTRTMPLRHEFGRLLDRQAARIEAAGVDLCLGRSAPEDLAESADIVFWAAGAVPRGQPLASGGAALTLEAALADPESLGRRVVLVDALGTWSVVSVAEWLADRGVAATLVAPTGTPGWTISLYSSFALRERLRAKRVRIVAGQALADAGDGVARLTDLSLGAPGETVEADSVIAPVPARPRVPPAFRRADGTAPRVVTIGDSLSARTALEAVFEGHEAALRL